MEKYDCSLQSKAGFCFASERFYAYFYGWGRLVQKAILNSDDVWTDDCEAALLEIEVVLCEKRVFDGFIKEYPSFSLGLTQMEKEIYCWLFHIDHETRLDKAFGCGSINVLRNDFLTLAPRIDICNYVLNVSSCVLNNDEYICAPSSPYRFLASTNTCLFTIVNASSNTDVSRNESNFMLMSPNCNRSII